MTRSVCRGKILFIDDLVTYEAASPAKLQKEFEAAVDDYLERWPRKSEHCDKWKLCTNPNGLWPGKEAGRP